MVFLLSKCGLQRTIPVLKAFQLIKMPAKVTLECIKQNAKVMERTLQELHAELATLTNQYVTLREQQLREENRLLSAAVEEAKEKLVQLERQQGIKQIYVPNQAVVESSSEQPVPPAKIENVKANVSQTNAATEIQAKPKKEKKPKEAKPKPPTTEEPPVDVGRLDLRIAKVEDVQKHPDADSLYVLKINCGEDKPRTVCSGLVKYVPIDNLRDRNVVLLCNLKPVKMRGITSEAMVMCASSPETVEVLSPPAGCKAGEPVHCEGYTRNPDPVMNPKKKVFETVAPDLATNDSLQACYKGAPLNIPGKGFILASTLKNVPVK